MEVTERLRNWAPGQFPDVDTTEVLHQLATLPDQLQGAGAERLQTALVLLSGGTWWGLQAAIRGALIDWRDTLVAAGLAHEDWPDRLDTLLGRPKPPAP